MKSFEDIKALRYFLEEVSDEAEACYEFVEDGMVTIETTDLGDEDLVYVTTEAKILQAIELDLQEEFAAAIVDHLRPNHHN